MKILIVTNNRGDQVMFQNLITWFNALGHECGSCNKLEPSPITDPEVALVIGNFIMHEDLVKMGVTSHPKRVCYNLGAMKFSNLVNDWRMTVFNDYFVSYSAAHAQYKLQSMPNKFNNLKVLPMPFEYRAIPANNYSNSELKISQALSDLALMGTYSKQSNMFAKSAKIAGVQFDLIFGKSYEDYLASKTNYPIVVDNLEGAAGKATWEGLASGQCVVGYFSEPFLQGYKDLFGVDLPVINIGSSFVTESGEIDWVAKQNALNQTFSDLKEGRIDWKAKCIESRQFMEKYYNPESITNAYLDYFQSIL